MCLKAILIHTAFRHSKPLLLLCRERPLKTESMAHKKGHAMKYHNFSYTRFLLKLVSNKHLKYERECSVFFLMWERNVTLLLARFMIYIKKMVVKME